MHNAFLILISMSIQFSKCDITTFCADKSERYYPYPDNCTKFIECYSGTTYIKDCPNGLFWNQGITVCDYTCGQNNTPSETSHSPTTTETPSQPAETTTQPAETTTPPTETTAQPTETTTLLIETTTQPTETTTQPTETTTQPTETTTQPTETTTTQPAETTTQPPETTTQPAETTTQPAETTTQPAETTTQPAESTTQPAETTTQPVEPTIQPVESTTQTITPEGGTCSFESNFTVNFNIRHTCPVEANITADSALECFFNCMHQNNCNFINYQITDMLCELLQCSVTTPTQVSASETVSIRISH